MKLPTPNAARWKALLEQIRLRALGKKRDRALAGLSRKPLSRAEFLDLEKTKLRESTVCHIIGSGWSLVDSMAAVRPEDYVVGYNLAALSGMKFDAYFTERINERVPGINDFYRRMLHRAGVINPYIKNIYERGASVDAINFHLQDGAIPLKTFNVGGYFSKGEESFLCSYLLDGGGPYFLQYRSSLMLLIVIYAKVGFRNIVLHGQDLSGPYYFDVAEFDLAMEFNPRHRGILPREIPNRSQRHIIDQAFARESQLVDILPVLGRLLSERGVSLSAATALSPIGRLIPIFKFVNPY